MFLCLRKIFFTCLFVCIGIIIISSFRFHTEKQFSQVLVGITSWNSINFNRTSIILLTNESFYREDRCKFVRDKCVNNRELSERSFSYLIHYNEMINYLSFVLRSHSIFYCSVPKVATRTLLLFITYLHIRDDLIPLLTTNSTLNLFKTDYFNKVNLSLDKNNSISILQSFLLELMIITKRNSSKIDLWSMYQEKVFPRVRLRSLSNPSIIFSSKYIRVLFVRHPFERLASAYIDKISTLSNNPLSSYDSLRRAICRRYSSFYLNHNQQRPYRMSKSVSQQINEPCAKIIPNFGHFVEYLMSDSLQDDVHWQPYSKLCQVCLFKYNFIGKYETIQEDMKQLIIRVGLNFNQWDNENYFTTGKTKENYKLLFSNLSNQLICTLKEFYKDDLDLFNYRVEDYLTDQKTIQCSAIHKPSFRKRRRFRG